ncbi:MAG: outer membrane protein assembly factor BamE [Betaproteobacteria bacterium]|nr:outer membrane protein assembly factor BamE [Betaproteobacteria bacterium]
MRKIILIAFLAGGCTDVPMLPTLAPYKIDIQQGNYVTQDMVAKLKPGMTRSQVRFILGTPLVVDPFRNDRWDYVYLYKKGGELTEQRRFAVIFKDDKLARIEGDVIPASPGSAADAAGAETLKPAVAAPPGPEEKSPAKPEAKPAEARPEAGAGGSAVLTTTSGEAVTGEPQKPEPADARAGGEKPAAESSQEERGFFGRMLDKLGF